MSRIRIHLLRAVNVGGSKLPMAELKKLASELGATDVSTYIASGNLICTPPDDPAEFDRALEKSIEKQFGFFREVISRSRPDVQKALDAHPFDVIEARFSYISFLLAKPTAAAIKKAQTFETGEDVWDVIDREMHIRYADGAGRPQMKDASVGRALGVPGTARNLNTVRKLLELTAE